VASPEQIAAIRARLGLDQPILVQFADWIGRLMRGDLGTSIISNQPVTRLIGVRLEPTLALATTTILFAVIVAVPLGVLSAWRHGTWIDRGVMTLSVLGFSIPFSSHAPDCASACSSSWPALGCPIQSSSLMLIPTSSRGASVSAL
jgi:ABC-type dipeptide/oligopeptide/nickel transport system permease component